jgi:hypothetical protein
MRDAIGAQSLIRNVSSLARYTKDNGLVRGKIPIAVAKPHTAKQISAILKIANKYRVPITTCSSGVHYGGYALPLVEGIVVDLGEMTSILEVDARNRMVRFEPGVRYAGLQGTLAKHQMMSLNPLLPHDSKSVMSSHLQREPMIIPKFEYGDDVLTMETVLPDGRLFRTGSAAAPGSPDNTMSDLVCPYGPGLDFFRLFLGAQGTLGIVTWMSCKIEFLPRLQKFLMIPFANVQELITPLYEIQRRMVGNECFLLDRQNFALIVSRPDEAKSMQEKLPPWTLFICLAGGPRRAEEKIEYEERIIESIARQSHLTVLNSESHGGASTVEKLMRGPWPSEQTYWKERDKGASYDLKLHTTLNRLPDMLEIIESHLSPCDFCNFGHYAQILERGRACYLETSIFYNHSSSRNRARIRQVVRVIAKELLSEGALFIEPDPIISDLVYAINRPYVSVLRKVKHLFDPNGIMNPGHLCF